MDARKLRKWSIVGLFAIFLLAGMWHFFYDVIPNPAIGLISPVNESPWEHSKLFFLPAILFFIVEYRAIGKQYPNYFFAHSVALFIMPVLMLTLYAIYFGWMEETLPVDLLNTAVTIAAGLFVAYRLTTSKRGFSGKPYRIASVLIPLAMLGIYIAFTFSPPHLHLFLDKGSMRYGIWR